LCAMGCKRKNLEGHGGVGGEQEEVGALSIERGGGGGGGLEKTSPKKCEKKGEKQRVNKRDNPKGKSLYEVA